MITLTNEQLHMISGGTISGTLINAFIRGVTTIIDAGRYLGSALRRWRTNNLCRMS